MNSDSPDRRISRTGDDIPFRINGTGSETGDLPILKEQIEEGETIEKPQPEPIKESKLEEDVEEVKPVKVERSSEMVES